MKVPALDLKKVRPRPRGKEIATERSKGAKNPRPPTLSARIERPRGHRPGRRVYKPGRRNAPRRPRQRPGLKRQPKVKVQSPLALAFKPITQFHF